MSGVQWILDNGLQSQAVNFLGSVSDSVNSLSDLGQSAEKNDVVMNQPPFLRDGQSAEQFNPQAQSAVSLWTNLSGRESVLFSKNIQRKLTIASLSKLMTALVVVENIDLSSEIKISDEAANQTKSPESLKAGEIFYAKDLLYATLIGSDNTASYALSESVGTDKFIELMNKKAEELGLSDTSFSNTTGLGLANFSTAQDLAKLAEYLLENRRSILGISTTQEFNLYTADKKVLHKIINTNELLKDSSGLSARVVGSKTGETRTAGECLLLVLKSPDGNSYLINVILNSNDRFGEMKKLINWVDAAYQWQ